MTRLPDASVFPSRDQLHELAAPGIAIPVVCVLDGIDVDPLAAFTHLAVDEPYAALLETSEAASGDADFSVVVPRTAGVLSGADVLDQIRGRCADRVADIGIELPRFVGGVVGMLGHEHVTTIEPRVGRASGAPAIETPDEAFLLVDEIVAFEHRSGRVLAVCTIVVDEVDDLDSAYDAAVARLAELAQGLAQAEPIERVLVDPGAGETTTATPNVDDAAFETMVREAQARVLAGECVQIVVSRRFDLPFTADPLHAYRAMRAVSPAPYHAMLRMEGVTIVGASPEQLVGVLGDERVVTHPIAGTRPRGRSEQQDLQLERDLLADPKERAEHMMLVDLGRNDVSRVSVPGSTEVARLCEVERFSHVMHLVSRVEGDLRADLHPVDALRAAFPAGTLTGAPKVRAMEHIARIEPDRRGAYGGVVGYVGHGRAMDMAITIRTAIVADGIASVQAGAGVVAASDPAAEAAETRHKARGMLAALGRAERLQHEHGMVVAPVGGIA